MAADINSVMLVGRLTKDAELKYSNAGLAIARFTIAVNRVKRSDGGQAGDDVSYFDLVMMGKFAESLSTYLKKGKQVAVTGELRQSRWESEGKKNSRIEIYVNSLQLLGGNSGNSSSSYPVDEPQQSFTPAANSMPQSSSDFEDDIPF